LIFSASGTGIKEAREPGGNEEQDEREPYKEEEGPLYLQTG